MNGVKKLPNDLGFIKSQVQLKVETKRNTYETQQVQRKKTSYNSIIVHTDHHSHSPMAPSHWI